MFRPASICKSLLVTLCLTVVSANVLATKVTMQTPLGDIEIELFDNDAPGTVANFLNYVNDGDYEDSFIHRSVPGFVIQGGGFNFKNGAVGNVPTDPPIQNEFNQSNLRGTIAMAKVGGDPDSATSQWFINLANNTNLDGDDGQGGGFFTVFGKVIGNGMVVVDAIAALQRVNAGGALSELPVQNFNGGTIVKENLIFANVVLSGTTEPGPTDCDGAFVSMNPDELVLEVLPTGGDDTNNIQCALNLAAQDGIPTVRLDQANYNISQLHINNFNGSFRGTTKDTSILNITDQSIDCSAFAAQGRTPAAIKFASGEPRLRSMTIKVSQPCQGTGTLQSLIHFTGSDGNDATCKNDVIFGNVDRVIIGSPAISPTVLNAISISPEGAALGGCKDTLLGTFKLNRSTITGFGVGIDSRLKGSGQVDINFSTFNDNHSAIDLVDSNQSTTITANTINSSNDSQIVSERYGISILSTLTDPPSKTRAVIHNNTFNFSDSAGSNTKVVRTNFQSKTQNISLIVSDNKFQLDGTGIVGINGLDINKVSISGNKFTGTGLYAIFAGTIIEQIISNWTITANTGLGSFSASNDIVLGQNSQKIIIGPGQDASVDDQGSGNIIL